jgi:hypothetical protein
MGGAVFSTREVAPLIVISRQAKHDSMLTAAVDTMRLRDAGVLQIDIGTIAPTTHFSPSGRSAYFKCFLV